MRLNCFALMLTLFGPFSYLLAGQIAPVRMMDAPTLGGFWLAPWAKSEQGAGAIYRFIGMVWNGFTGISIANSICFCPRKACAYYTDTLTGQIMRQNSMLKGGPMGRWRYFGPEIRPVKSRWIRGDSGAVCGTRNGRFAVALFWLCAFYAPSFPATDKPSGFREDLSQLFVTSATMGMRFPKGEGARISYAFLCGTT